MVTQKVRVIFFIQVFIISLFTCVNLNAQCPEVELIDLRGVPGYAQVDDINICGPADTISLIVYTGDPGIMIGFELSVGLPDGLEYAGWEFAEFEGTSISNSDADPSCPEFIVDGFDGDSLVVVNIGVRANCEVDLNKMMFINYEYNYKFLDTLNVLHSCGGVFTPEAELNSAIKTPVLNVLSGVTPAELEITDIGSTFCQDFQISQDGLSSYLDSFTFEIAGLDFSSDLVLTSITANATENVPFVFDAGSMSTTATIKGDMFLGNDLANPANQQFNTNEILGLTVCYQLNSCPDVANLPFNYNAYYGCDGEQCQISGQSSYLRIRPTGSQLPTATATLSAAPFVCGADGEIAVSVTNPNLASDQNKYTDLSIGFETCEAANLGISKVEINGTLLPANTYGWIGDDLNVDFSAFPSGFNPDGAGGLEDIDGDGVFDDLSGGSTVSLTIFIEVLCGVSDVAPNTDICPDNNCGFGQFYVSGKTNCGNEFDKYPPSVSGFDITYGPTQVWNDNERGIPDDVAPNFITNGYDFGKFGDLGSSSSPNPTAKTQEVIFCYDFASTNFNSCSSNDIFLQINFTGEQGYIYDIDMLSAELSVDGGLTYTSSANMATDTTWRNIDEGSRILEVALGSDAANICYKYVLEMDSIWCPPPAYFFGAQQVIDRCSDAACGIDGCDLLRACKTATFYGDADHYNCPCVIEGDVREMYRVNYGYSDATMTTKLTKDDVDFEDHNRFLPCDTMYMDYYFIVTDQTVLNQANLSRFTMGWWMRGSDGGRASLLEANLMPNPETTELLEVAVQKMGTTYNSRQIIDFAAMEDCADDGFFFGFQKTPYGDIGFPTCANSSDDYYDGTFNRFILYNNDKVNGTCSTSSTGNCLDAFLLETNYKAGDTIRVKFQYELMKNPQRAAYEAVGNAVPPTSTNQLLTVSSYIDFIDEGAGNCYTRLANDCAVDIPLFGTCPGNVTALSNVNLGNCGGNIEHTFYMNPEIPVGWFDQEFRPVLGIMDIEDPLFAPMAYCGNAKIQNFANGVMTEIPISPLSNENLFCVPVTGYDDDLCAIETGTEGSLFWNPTTSGARALGIGNVASDSMKLVYDFCLICPEELSATDYQMEFDYGYLCNTLPDPCHFACNISSTPTFCDLNNFTQGESFFHGLVGDSIFISYDNLGPNVLINDTRTPLQNVSVNYGIGASTFISSSNPGVSEEIQPIDLSNVNIGDNITGVGATVKVPTTVKFVNAYSDAGGTMVLPSTLISDNGVYKIYSITLNSTMMTPSTTQNIYIGTTLLYCPEVGEVTPNICVGGISGCSPIEVAAALSAASGCGTNEVCYTYVFGEADLQTEWFDMPSNPNLCDEMIFNVRVKNVKELTLLELITSFELPAGLTVDMTSWEVAYPGGPTTTGTWVSVPAPDQVVGNVYTYTNDNIWSIPAGTPIHNTGLEGVSAANATADGNKVAFRFKARTNCDEYLSGAKFRTETLANDPCAEGNLSSGVVESPGLVLNGANPVQSAQLIVLADPLELNCMASVNTFGMTAINTSAYPTADSVITCITIPEGLTYTPGSISVNQPAGYTITGLTEVAVGTSMQVCFVSPKIGVSQAMKLSFDAAVDNDMECGDIRMDVDIKSVVKGLVCSTGPNCDVFVQNSINPSVTVEIRPLYMAEDWNVYSECASGDDVSLRYAFRIDHNGPDATNQTYTANFYQDVDGDNLINPNIDNLLVSDNGMFSVNDGSTVNVSGNVIINQTDACPVMMELVYGTACACDRDEKLFEDINLYTLAEYTEPISMCPGDCITVEVCDFVEVGADSVIGATGIEYLPGLDWSRADEYTIPHDSTVTPIKKGPVIDFVLYETLTDNQASEPINRRGGLLFPEQSPSANPSGEAYLMATFPKPVNVERLYLAAGLVAGWAYTPGLAVYGGRKTQLEYSLDGGATWINSGLYENHPNNNTDVFEYILPTPIVAQHWRLTSEGIFNWGTSEFRFEGDAIPFEGLGPVSRAGNTVTICVPEDMGIERPFEVVFDAGLGQCSNLKTLEIWNIDNNRISLGEDLIVCGDECFDLDVEVIGEGTLENATVTWTPTTGMIDPTSFNPEICGLTSDVTYIAEVTFPGGCIKKDTISVDYRTVPAFPTAEIINFCVRYDDATLMANTGFAEYKWYQMLGGNEIQIATTTTNSYTVNLGGTYRYKAFDGVDLCQVDAGEFTVIEDPCIDYGDLPDTGAGTNAGNYETDSINGGPGHLITPGLSLGASVDEEFDGQQSSDALGDGADDDGISFPTNMQTAPGGTLNIPFSATNTLGETAYFEMWIDWNGDGDFDDPGEMVSNIDDASGFPAYLPITIPQDVVQNQEIGVRLRLSNTDDMTPYGQINSGEIEDYLIEISCSSDECLTIQSISN